jgi:ankyrin repeat protein
MDNVKHGPLETAILNECGDYMIDLLLEYGADVNLQAYQQRTPLFTAVISGKTTAVALLLARGANVHARELKHGRIPLHFAAENAGSSGMVKMLLDAGSDVNCLSDSGMTPLHTAAYGHAADVIQILLDSGADVRLQTPTGYNGGQTAFHYASKSWGGSRDVIGLLVSHGADVNSRDFRQRTPLDKTPKLKIQRKCC